jgi:Tfp pilus assembly protein PilF
MVLGLVASALASEPEWLEVRSPHFSVVTDAGEKRGREAALRFEQMRAVFGVLMTKAKVTMPVPLQIVAFRDGAEVRQFVPLWRGKPAQVAGLFEGSNDRNFIILDMTVPNPWQVVFHEYAHELLNGNTDAQSQPWFDEGFAEFFSTIRVRGKEAEIGLPAESNLRILQRAPLMNIADLFRVRQDSSIYRENGDHQSLFYAQSWLVVHYFYDKQWLPKMAQYFALAVEGGIPVEKAIPQAFGVSVADLDNAVRQYLSRNQLRSYGIPVPGGIESTEYAVRRLAIGDARAVLADVHLHSTDYQDQAVAELEEVIKSQPENATALRGLGYAYLIKRDYPHAAEYFTKALKHEPDDPRLLYYSAMLIQSEGGPGSGDRKQLGTAQKQLEKSVALDPEYADAYRLLALTYASLGKKDEALRTMRKAVDLNPRNEQYLFNLAQMYMVNGKYDESIVRLQPLTEARDPEIRARAEKELLLVRAIKRASLAGVPVEPRSGTVPETAQTLDAVSFLTGKLDAVDCSASPEATLTIISEGKTWKLHARDSALVIVMGADKFSCEWTNQKVAVNYRKTGEGAAELISVEVQ